MSGTNNPLIIQELTHEDDSVSAVLGIDVGHDILKGHFPGHPVVPGACMLQIVKEVLEKALGHPLRLKKAGTLKFLNMIDPGVTTEIHLHLSYHTDEEGAIMVNAKLSSNQVLHFKFQGSFTALS